MQKRDHLKTENVEYIGVIGAESSIGQKIHHKAEKTGELIGESGGVMICGGKGGVMEAASRGCQKTGGTVIGILPSPDRSDANSYLDYSLTTGMGQARNLMIVTSSKVVIAIAGGTGTLSEIALARKHQKPVILLDSWPLPDIEYDHSTSGFYQFSNPERTVDKAFELC
ncbi:TIGR00725 family protein [Halarsenatibacter silvermanii]|uniref:TIGR00725 family protein n=1 Tax=Halarsenatibacter silvermanii TaxID=321763 RepID=A0A1G9LM53_9FIRM|nr:TIGR00725 family protein [Halarsenatibacter silvermanii]SDL62924.1 hypothetical protein SAMN04488692_106107 [Halarsenatibacter silvermanii]